MKCPHCNGKHPVDTKFCPYTGKKIEPMFTACKNPDCPDNGKYILPLDFKFCTTCGKRLEKEVKQDSNKINGHEYVDLGLPSGTLWATCNVGASTPSDYGDYFAWGETSPKEEYELDNLEYCNDDSGDEFSKYVAESECGDVDNKTRLEMQDDTARTNWGGSWRMPTQEEWGELFVNCTWQWTIKGGHEGYKFTSNTNNKSIFLPATGFCGDPGYYGFCANGRYWSSSLRTDGSDGAYVCYFDSSLVCTSISRSRFNRLSVRLVSSSLQN